MSTPPLASSAISQGLDSALRPADWEEYVGQKQVKANVRIAIDAAMKRGGMPEHFLFYGPPGVGKTTLAHLVARALGSPLKTTSGVAIERAADLAAILTNLDPGTVLFIDEIHRLSHKIEELLYPALEGAHLDIVLLFADPQEFSAYRHPMKLSRVSRVAAVRPHAWQTRS